MLPKHQSVYFTDKSLMEFTRITAQLEDLSISEFVQLATREFLTNPNRKEIVARYKLFKSLDIKGE